MTWEIIAAPPGLAPPRPLTVRAQSIPARHYFPEHAHAWGQAVYAISGVLAVAVEGRSFVISPEQAVWLPTGLRHRVGSLLGAEFRSLWIATRPVVASRTDRPCSASRRCCRPSSSRPRRSKAAASPTAMQVALRLV